MTRQQSEYLNQELQELKEMVSKMEPLLILQMIHRELSGEVLDEGQGHENFSDILAIVKQLEEEEDRIISFEEFERIFRGVIERIKSSDKAFESEESYSQRIDLFINYVKVRWQSEQSSENHITKKKLAIACFKLFLRQDRIERDVFYNQFPPSLDDLQCFSGVSQRFSNIRVAKGKFSVFLQEITEKSVSRLFEDLKYDARGGARAHVNHYIRYCFGLINKKEMEEQDSSWTVGVREINDMKLASKIQEFGDLAKDNILREFSRDKEELKKDLQGDVIIWANQVVDFMIESSNVVEGQRQKIINWVRDGGGDISDDDFYIKKEFEQELTKRINGGFGIDSPEDIFALLEKQEGDSAAKGEYILCLDYDKVLNSKLGADFSSYRESLKKHSQSLVLDGQEEPLIILDFDNLDSQKNVEKILDGLRSNNKRNLSQSLNVIFALSKAGHGSGALYIFRRDIYERAQELKGIFDVELEKEEVDGFYQINAFKLDEYLERAEKARNYFEALSPNFALKILDDGGLIESEVDVSEVPNEQILFFLCNMTQEDSILFFQKMTYEQFRFFLEYASHDLDFAKSISHFSSRDLLESFFKKYNISEILAIFVEKIKKIVDLKDLSDDKKDNICSLFFNSIFDKNFAGDEASVFDKVISGFIKDLPSRHFPQDLLLRLAHFGYVNSLEVVLGKDRGFIDERHIVPSISNNSQTALMVSILSGHKDVSEKLIEAGANLNLQDDNKETALMMAIIYGKVDVAQALINKGADLNLQDNNKRTALMMAIMYGHVDVVQALINKGANLNLQDDNKETALMMAIIYGKVDVAQALINKVIDLNLKNVDGQTALMIAIIYGNVDVAQALIVEGSVEINEQDNNGRTAFMIAAAQGNLVIVEALIQKGLNLNDGSGDTVLMIAAREGNIDVVNFIFLEYYEADIDAKNNSGLTALMIAAREGKVGVVKALVYLGADLDLLSGSGDTVLMIAAREGNIDVVNFILREYHEADIDAQNNSGLTALMIAARAGKVDVVEALVESAANLDLLSGSGDTALMIAAREGNIDVTEVLVDADANVDLLSRSGDTAAMIALKEGNVETPLMIVVRRGDLKAVTSILNEGEEAYINLKNRDGDTALMIALNIRQFEVAENLIVAKGVDLNLRNVKGQTVLMIALNTGYLPVVEDLIAAEGVELNVQDNDGKMALMIAIEQGHISVAQALIKKGVKINLKNVNGQTPLMIAIELGHVSVVQDLILAQGINLNEYDRFKETALMIAVRERNVQVVQDLIKKNVDLNVKNLGGQTALMIAIDEGHIAVAQVLIVAEGVELNVQDKDGKTALMIAIEQGYIMVVQALIRKGVDLNAQDKYGRTALMFAVEQGNIEILEDLIKAGADLDLLNGNGKTALMLAIENKDVACVNSLIILRIKDESLFETPLISAARIGNIDVVNFILEEDYEVNINAQNGYGLTALMIALRYRNVAVAQLLIQKGVDLNISNENGYTALMIAAIKGYVQVVQDLIKKGADINLKNKKGQTALMFAIERGHVEVVRELIAVKGIKLDVQDKNGRTAFMIAVAQGNPVIVEALIGAGVDLNLQDKLGDTALLSAIKAKDYNSAHIILSQDETDVTLKDKDGNNALMIAVKRGLIKVAMEIMKKDPSHINARNNNGNTVLTLAVKSRSVRAVKAILEQDPYIDSENEEGDNALTVAVRLGLVEIVSLIVEKILSKVKQNIAARQEAPVELYEGTLTKFDSALDVSSSKLKAERLDQLREVRKGMEDVLEGRSRSLRPLPLRLRSAERVVSRRRGRGAVLPPIRS